jgi:hypothetical protein
MRCLLRRLTLFAWSILFCYQGPALADLISPLTISNYNPLVAVHGLPYAGDAEVLKAGAANTQLIHDVSSHYAIDKNADELILLDGETHRTTFIYRQGIANGLEAGLVIPYLKHKAGGLDSFINDWHQAFGMPQGGRNLTANNQFRYIYVRHSKTRFDMHSASGGIGDVRLQGAWQLQSDTTQASAMALSIKFPTGGIKMKRGNPISAAVAAVFILWVVYIWDTAIYCLIW